ncbi:hypothetical protein MRB53_039538 [Persea americana]|nr:hypothetical protein MRB53_039538 [Persea americana]
MRQSTCPQITTCSILPRVLAVVVPQVRTILSLISHVTTLTSNTYLPQEERNRNEHYTEEAEQTRRPIDTEVVVHRRREQRERGAEAGPHEVVAGEHGRRFRRVRVREVVEHSIEEQDGADAEKGRADDGDDPVCPYSSAYAVRGTRHIPLSTPPEEEETDCDARTADDGGRQTALRLDLAFLVELRLLHFIQVPEVWRDGDDCADEDADEGETFGAEGEAVKLHKDDGEGLKLA